MKLSSVSVQDMHRELARRERGASKLLKQRAKLQKQLDGMLAELANLGVDGSSKRRGRPPGRRGPGRPKGSKGRGPGRPKGSKNKKAGRPKGKRMKNAMSLLEAITKGVRKGSTVSPAEAGAAAKKAGYKSASPNFGMMVANTLAKSPSFKRTGRGQYLHKGGGKVGKPKAGPKKRRSRRSAKRAKGATRRGRKPGRKLGATKPAPAPAAPIAS